MKYITLIFLSLISISISAQIEYSDSILTNKKGNPILPQTGDWSIGTTATPFLQYFGNIFSSDYTDTPYFSSSNSGNIFAKYQKKTNLSYRLGLSIGSSNDFQKIANPSNSDEYDKGVSSALSLSLSLGFEKYKSYKKRLRGYFGADISFSKSPYFGTHYFSFDYIEGIYKYSNVNTSSLNYSEIGGNTYSISGVGFIGAEYFFAPKISLSGEFGMGAAASFTGDRKYNPENGPSLIFVPGSNKITIFTNNSSSIKLFFYF